MKVFNNLCFLIVFLLLLTASPTLAQPFGGGHGMTGGHMRQGKRPTPNATGRGQDEFGNQGTWRHNKHPEGFTPQPQTSSKSDFPSDKAKVSKVVLRDHTELEQAAAKYVISYDAYTAAKTSNVPEIKQKTGEFLKEYRIAYAEFLRLLKEDNIYDPKMPKNHAGIYNQKYEEVNNETRDWSDQGIKEMGESIKDMVARGGNIDDIHNTITNKANLFLGSTAPSEFYFEADPPPVPISTGLSNDDDDDDDDDNSDDEN